MNISQRGKEERAIENWVLSMYSKAVRVEYWNREGEGALGIPWTINAISCSKNPIAKFALFKLGIYVYVIYACHIYIYL